LLLAGGAMLYFGAEWLVSASSGLARAFEIPELLVGLTVVAYGTSAPEVVVGIQAAAAGHGDMALGNVIGSNIANLGLILGTAAMIKPARINGLLGRREVVMAASALLVPAVLWRGLDAGSGALLLVASVAYTAWMVLASRKPAVAREAAEHAQVSQAAAETAGAPPRGSKKRQAMVAVVLRTERTLKRWEGALLLGGYAVAMTVVALKQA
jgi:cation:H+ antiporter